ncbi:MAG: hypothetical protein HC906_13715 [Bacteroidales bacterium]|nr:hypothetical protein [Bacteroidales bacterium]
MPLLGMVVIFHSGTTLTIMDKQLIRLIYLFVGFITLLLPLAFIPLLIQLKVIQSIEMNKSRERVIPYFLTFILYYTAHFLVGKLSINYYFAAYLFSASILVLTLLIISYFWKMSTHMAGMGGLAGLVLSLSFEFRADLMYYLVLLLVISGILASARLKLNSHTPAQIFWGFLTGIVIVPGIIHLMYAYRI